MATAKIKKTNASDPPGRLVRNPTILPARCARRRAIAERAPIVGFAAETGDANGDVLFHARKLRPQGL